MIFSLFLLLFNCNFLYNLQKNLLDFGLLRCSDFSRYYNTYWLSRDEVTIETEACTKFFHIVNLELILSKIVVRSLTS